jgi:hypothetical protein
VAGADLQKSAQTGKPGHRLCCANQNLTPFCALIIHHLPLAVKLGKSQCKPSKQPRSTPQCPAPRRPARHAAHSRPTRTATHHPPPADDAPAPTPPLAPAHCRPPRTRPPTGRCPPPARAPRRPTASCRPGPRSRSGCQPCTRCDRLPALLGPVKISLSQGEIEGGAENLAYLKTIRRSDIGQQRLQPQTVAVPIETRDLADADRSND